MSDTPRGSVTVLPVVTKYPIPVDRVLEAAREAELADIIILGYDKEGNEFFSSSISDGGAVLWLIERLKTRLVNLEYSDHD